MRVEADKRGDKTYDVWLDGVKQNHVVLADEEAGYVDVVAFNSDGDCLLSERKIQTVRLVGNVEIRQTV